MDSTELPKYAEKLLHQIAKENGFSDYSVRADSVQAAGDGFSSEIFEVTINETNSGKTLDLICKLPKSSEAHQKRFENRANDTFKHEALLYSKFMPILTDFQNEKKMPKIDQFSSYPTCYGTLINKGNVCHAIVLEDLRKIGFELWNKTKVLPIENVRLTMRELGKLHGLSITLKDQKPRVFSEFKQMKNYFNKHFQMKAMRDILNTMFDRAIISLINENHKAIMRDIKDNLDEYSDDCFDEEACDRFGVLCHGDCWNNNIMYRFNELGVAEDIRFLDWQVINYASPAIDLLYNIFTSTDRAFRDKEYENMLKCYHDSLCKTVRSLGSDPDNLFTYDNLKDELRKFGNYALILSPLVIGISQVDSSEISNLNEFEEEKESDLITGLSGNRQNEFDRRINEVVEDIIKMGYYRPIRKVK